MSTPFMFTDDSLDGEIVFKLPELAVKYYYEITIEVDSIIWESTRLQKKNSLNLTATEKELLKRQKIKLHSGNECPVKFAIALSQLSEIQSDSFAYIMFKVQLKPDVVEIVSGDTSKVKIFREATDPYVAVLKVKLQKKVNIGAWFIPIFWIVIVLAILCLLFSKVFPYLRFHYGLLNALEKIYIKIAHPDLEIQEHGVYRDPNTDEPTLERDFNGKIRIRFKDKKEKLYHGHLHFRPFGSKNLDELALPIKRKKVIVVENEIIHGEYRQTFLEIDRIEETCHIENLLPEGRAIIIPEEEFEKKGAVRLVIHPQVMNQQGKDKKYYEISIAVTENPNTVRSIWKKILRRMSSYLDFKNCNSRCRIEKIGIGLSLSSIILSYSILSWYNWAQFKHNWIKLILLLILVVIISWIPVSKIRSGFKWLTSGKIVQEIFEWIQKKFFS